MCIGVGLALGAEHRLLAAVAVVIVTIFVVVRRFLGRSVSRQNLLLTVIGDAERFVDTVDTADEANVVEALERLTGGLSIQRFDLEDGQVQIRAKVSPGGPKETTQLITEIKKAFPPPPGFLRKLGLARMSGRHNSRESFRSPQWKPLWISGSEQSAPPTH